MLYLFNSYQMIALAIVIGIMSVLTFMGQCNIKIPEKMWLVATIAGGFGFGVLLMVWKTASFSI